MEIHGYSGNMLKEQNGVTAFFLVLIQENKCTFIIFGHDNVIENCSMIRNMP